MTEDDDWDYEGEEEEEEPGTSRKLIIMAVVAVLIIASLGSYLVLMDDDDDELPSKVNVPSLHVGMDWWHHLELQTVDHVLGTSKTEDWGIQQIMVRNRTTLNGRDAYGMSSIDEINTTTTRHSDSMEFYLSAEGLNSMDGEGETFVIFDFPLFDGKTWNWTDEHDENVTYICNTFRDVVTTCGTYDTYRIRMTWIEDEGNDRGEFTYDYYYSPKLMYLAKAEMKVDYYEDNALAVTETIIADLFLHGTSDSDNDGLSNEGEKWFGTNSNLKDTDSDGLDDLEDHVPLLDIGLSINLTYVSTDDNVESIEETTLLGEQNGADFYFDLSNDNNDDTLVTDPIDNSDSSELDIIYRIDVSDDEKYVYFSIDCFDVDENNADDEMDISPSDMGSPELLIRLRLIDRRLHIVEADPPEDRMELGVEKEVIGNGDGDYDATLRLIVSEIDMALYT